MAFVSFEFLIPNFDKKTEKIGVIGEYTSYEIPNSILNLIGKGLTTLNSSGQAVPGIVSSWETADAGRTWIFHIDKTQTWQDGTKVTAQDINYNFGDAQVVRDDKYTIEYKLNSSFSPFPVTLSRPIFKKGLLGTGDWSVTDLSLAGTFVSSLTLKDKTGNEKIFKFYPTEERAKLAYQLGEIDSLGDMTDPKPFDTWTTSHITKQINNQRYVAVFFNTTDDILSDKNMRQALSYAIDKDMLGSDRALGPISPNSWAYNSQVKPYDYNIDRAKQLISDSKISDDAKKNLKIQLTTVPDLLPVAEKIVKDWHAVGITTTLQVTSYLPDQYQAFLAVYDSPPDPDQYSTWHSTQTQTNISRYKNPRIDKLLEDGRLESDQSKRKGIYIDFQRFLVEDAPAAFLYHPVYYSVSRN